MKFRLKEAHPILEIYSASEQGELKLVLTFVDLSEISGVRGISDELVDGILYA